jgi:hypothetical protein
MMAKAGSKESEFSGLPERRPSAQTIIIGGGQLLEPRQDFGIVFPGAGQFLNGTAA